MYKLLVAHLSGSIEHEQYFKRFASLHIGWKSHVEQQKISPSQSLYTQRLGNRVLPNPIARLLARETDANSTTNEMIVEQREDDPIGRHLLRRLLHTWSSAPFLSIHQDFLAIHQVARTPRVDCDRIASSVIAPVACRDAIIYRWPAVECDIDEAHVDRLNDAILNHRYAIPKSSKELTKKKLW